MGQVRPTACSGSSWDYQRFVVLGQQRCGTTMLLSALNNHPHIKCSGEIFHARAFDRRSSRDDEAVRAPRLKKLFRHLMPITYAHRKAYHGHEIGIAAVGFKLMIGQLLSFRSGTLVKFLTSNDDIKLIHVWRRDTLKRYLSGQIARRFPATFGSRTDPVRPPPIRLDPEKCEADFLRVHERKAYVQRAFAGPRLLTVTYEELVEDPHQAYHDIQQHLGVDTQPILPDTRKQRIWPVAELISNYDELASYFLGSRWEHCFAESKD